MMERGHFYSDSGEKSNGAKGSLGLKIKPHDSSLIGVFASGTIFASVFNRSRNLND